MKVNQTLYTMTELMEALQLNAYCTTSSVGNKVEENY